MTVRRPKTDTTESGERAALLCTIDPPAAMSALCATFPSIRAAPGVRPWDPDALARWGGATGSADGARESVAFVLSVWSPDHAFDLSRALAVWDATHRAAFLAWASDPWWPLRKP